MLIDWLSVLIGTWIGLLLSWLFIRRKYEKNHLAKQQVERDYVLREIHLSEKKHLQKTESELEKNRQEVRDIERELSASGQMIRQYKEQLSTRQEEVEIMQTTFENLANRLLEDKSEKFTRQNKTQLDALLQPLQLKIKDFEEKVEKTYRHEAEERISLREEIKQLRDLNMQLSNDANSLAHALKGDSRMQGDWGEMSMELLLERAGLQLGVHYQKQVSHRDQGGNQKRPDFIIHLPDDKHIVVDSKVSLTAYSAHFEAGDEVQKARYLKAHQESIKNHIRDLSAKRYEHLYQINTPDYVLMYIPIEPAFTLALQQNSDLYLDALDKNIVMVTNSTLLATLRTISYIWKQEKQKKNVLEIARQSGLLYDKFVGFVDDLKEVGKKIDNAQTTYDAAMNKLTTGKGNLIRRAEHVRELGAKASKSLPKNLIEDAEQKGMLKNGN